MRVLISLFLLIFLLSFPTPSWAQETDSSSQFTEEQLQRGDEIAEKAFQALQEGDFAQSETYWGELIELFPHNPAVWSNRGNVRLSQNKVESAIADYNKAIALAPNQPDPYLNRGIAYEIQQDWKSAIKDYDTVLELDPEDAMAYNNRGNAKAGQGNYQAAITDYEQAASLDPDFAIARANAALSHYQVGDEKEALDEARKLVRKYPNFPDVRAALTAILWAQGQEGEAESNWVAVMGSDSRYRNIEWLEQVRRWPPRMVEALDNFLTLNH
jgi:tetratricopeptide (TPR) repeat protein